ncbi:hypothetical protein EXS71_02195 [Candidatus Uhrbacteria bacterium]|nr:hypothetical protein [Candidatus Uhrbacteria bacterium]
MKKISNLDRLVSAIEKVDFDFSDKQKTTSYKRKNNARDSVNTKIRSYTSESKSKEAKLLTKSSWNEDDTAAIDWQIRFSRLGLGLRETPPRRDSEPVDSSGLAAGVRRRAEGKNPLPPRRGSGPVRGAESEAIVTPGYISSQDAATDGVRHGYSPEEARAARFRYASHSKMPSIDGDIDPETRQPWHPGPDGFNQMISRFQDPKSPKSASVALLNWMSNYRLHAIESRIRGNFPSTSHQGSVEIPLFDNKEGQSFLFREKYLTKSVNPKNNLFKLIKAVAKIEAQFLRNYI